MSEHTKGPWGPVNPMSAWVEVPDRDAPICAMLWPTSLRSEAETFANARLIAAAPDLLERLIAVTDSLEAELQARYPVEAENGEGPMRRQYMRDMQEVWDARAAIAKATPASEIAVLEQGRVG